MRLSLSRVVQIDRRRIGQYGIERRLHGFQRAPASPVFRRPQIGLPYNLIICMIQPLAQLPLIGLAARQDQRLVNRLGTVIGQVGQSDKQRPLHPSLRIRRIP